MADFKEGFSDMQMWCQVACVENSPCAAVIAVTQALGSFCFQAGLMSLALLVVALDCFCSFVVTCLLSLESSSHSGQCLCPMVLGTAALCDSFKNKEVGTKGS